MITQKRYCLLVVCLLVGCTSGQTPDRAPAPSSSSHGIDASKPTEEVLRSIVEQKTKEIEAELKRLGPDHSWAGHYIASPGFSYTSLMTAPESGFVMEWS